MLFHGQRCATRSLVQKQQTDAAGGDIDALFHRIERIKYHIYRNVEDTFLMHMLRDTGTLGVKAWDQWNWGVILDFMRVCCGCCLPLAVKLVFGGVLDVLGLCRLAGKRGSGCYMVIRFRIFLHGCLLILRC
jgi:hypothetical protein